MIHLSILFSNCYAAQDKIRGTVFLKLYRLASRDVLYLDDRYIYNPIILK